MVKDHSDSGRGNFLPPLHGLHFSIIHMIKIAISYKRWYLSGSVLNLFRKVY